MSGMSPSLTSLLIDKTIEFAVKDGTAAGKRFVVDYGIGLNANIDALILEGLETNVSLIIQRLPWASVVPALHLSKEFPREVYDDLIWTYMATYDQASRKVIRDAISNSRKNEQKNRKG